jgi:type I restriction enzyme R subunit
MQTLAAEMDEAGYSAAEQDEINRKVDFYLKLREEIRMASGETLDMKAYEADMRHLIDNYIQAEDPKTNFSIR